MVRKVGPLRLVVTVVTAAVLLALGGIAYVRAVGAVEPDLGVEWVGSNVGPLAIAVAPGGAAWDAGLRPGDVLERIDGRAVGNAIEATERPWTLAPGESLDLAVRRGGETLDLVVAPRPASRPEPYGFLCVVGFAFLVSGAFVALRWPTVRGGTTYALLAAAMYGRLVFTATGAAEPLDWLFYWLDVASAAFAPALLVHLAVDLSRRVVPRVAIAVPYGLAGLAGLAAIWLQPAAFGGAYRAARPEVAVEWIDRGLTLLFAVAVVAAAAVLNKAYARSRSSLQRGQLRWMLWGLLLGFLPFVLLHAAPWSLGGTRLPSWVQFFAVAPMVAVPAAFTVAMARYRLHDLDVLLRRAATEVSAVLTTFAVYASVVYLLRHGAIGALDFSNSATRYVGIFLAAVSYPQLREWMKGGVDRAFYRRRYSYRTTLLDWARDLSAETDLDSLVRGVSERVRETLGVPHARVLVASATGGFEDPREAGAGRSGTLPEEILERLEHDPAVVVESEQVPDLPWTRYVYAMRVKGRLRAALVVAERVPPEEPLSSEDRALLATLAAHAATAIEAARLLREVRRHAEEVERLHARERTILESSAVGLLMLDARGRIATWNRALEEIYDLPRERAIDRTLADVFPLQFAREVEREIEASRGRPDPRAFRYVLVNRAGERVVLNLSISPAIGGVDGDGARVVTFDDVSERVKLEQQVLRQERLASLGLLAAGVAHEVNTPLTGISSYTQMLMDDLDAGDPRRRTLEKIEAQTQRASNIANSLLNLAHPERTPFQELDVNAVVEECLQLFEPQVRGGGVRLEVRLHDSLPPIRGHRGKLQQVLLNLLINARDAVGRHGRIVVATAVERDRVVLTVEDDGVGIDEQDLARIFDPFFTTKGRGRGTGLGLSISYGIVREHEGEIHVESERGDFTRFTIELPTVGVAEAMG